MVRSVLSVMSVCTEGVGACFALALEPARGSADRLRDMDAKPASLPSRSVASICNSAIFCKRSEGVGEAFLATAFTVELSRDLCSLGVSQLNWLLIQELLDSAELRCISLPRGKSSSWPFPIGEDAVLDMSLLVRLRCIGIGMFVCSSAGAWGVGVSSRETCLDSGVLAVDCIVATVMVDAAEGLWGRCSAFDRLSKDPRLSSEGLLWDTAIWLP